MCKLGVDVNEYESREEMLNGVSGIERLNNFCGYFLHMIKILVCVCLQFCVNLYIPKKTFCNPGNIGPITIKDTNSKLIPECGAQIFWNKIFCLKFSVTIITANLITKFVLVCSCFMPHVFIVFQLIFAQEK